MTDHDASADYDRPATGVRTPWKMPVHNSVLIAGLRAIVADALARDDYHTAAYACSVLDGDPIAPQEPVPTYDLWTQVPPGVYGKCARCGHVFTIGHTSRITWEVPGLTAPVCPVGEGCQA